MKFNSGKEMYELITSGVDLYNKNDGVYVFLYNDADALCCYYLDEDEAKSIASDANNANEYWGAFLGVGGYILDDTDYDCFRYSNNEDERYLYLSPSFEFCNEYYNHNGWMTTKEFSIKE